VPVWLRPPPDFLGQGDPFQLSGGGTGVIEFAGIDYLLPYRMARYLGLRDSIVVQSAAAPLAVVPPDSLASIFGANLALTDIDRGVFAEFNFRAFARTRGNRLTRRLRSSNARPDGLPTTQSSPSSGVKWPLVAKRLEWGRDGSPLIRPSIRAPADATC
jgi:hypothetical protein